MFMEMENKLSSDEILNTQGIFWIPANSVLYKKGQGRSKCPITFVRLRSACSGTPTSGKRRRTCRTFVDNIDMDYRQV